MSLSRFPIAASEDAASDLKNSESKDSRDFVFWGRHLIASYGACKLERLTDAAALVSALKEAISVSSASLLSEVVHVFPNGGITAVFLLAESHASIHTYPEHASCFLDLFTCGDACNPEAFDMLMRQYLSPRHADVKILLRHESSEDPV
ncbi:MAG: adenosylmethionine decarboxylase [Candidatus Obscuribacterales bacterium]|nr:adenosylmethionine decarboxylase [Candidatus Obscuribacterales bacterium]